MRMKRLLVAVGLLVLVAFVGFAVYWWIAADRLRQGLEEMRTQLAAFGIVVESGEPEIGGFPLRLTVRLPKPVLTLEDGSRVTGPQAIDGAVWLWDLRHLALSGPGRYQISLPQNDLQFEAQGVSLELELEDGLFDAVALELESAVLTNQSTTQSLAVEQLSISLEQMLPRDGRGHDTAFSLRLAGMPLPPQAETARALLGEQIDRVVLSGRFQGVLLPGSPRDMAALWRDGGGIVDFEEIEIAWGDLRLEGAGTVTLDEAFRPLGAFSFESAGLLALVRRLGEGGAIEAETARALDIGLSELVSGRDALGRAEIALPVTLQDGQLTFARVPVGPLRPLF